MHKVCAQYPALWILGAKYVLTFTNSNYIKKYYLSTFTDRTTDMMRGDKAFQKSQVC